MSTDRKLNLSAWKVKIVENNYFLDIFSDSKACEENGQKFTCFKVKVCYKFDHASIDKIQGNKMLNYHVTVDSITEEGY